MKIDNKKHEDKYPAQIHEDSIVLEVGSGNSPWPRADILVEQYLEDSFGHRGGANVFYDNRPLLVASGQKLPLQDKSVDFVYCGHVLDHVEDPSAMLHEMARVGKAGYIECSNPLMEKLQNPSVHLWYVAANENKLYLAEKTIETNVSDELDTFIFHLLSDHFLIKQYWSYFITTFHWKGNIEFEICDVKKIFSLVKLNPDYQKIILRKRMCSLFRMFMEAFGFYFWDKIRHSSWSNVFRYIRKKIVKQTLESPEIRASDEVMERILMCPKCGDSFKMTGTQLICNRCGHKVLQQGNIFHFIDEEINNLE